MIKLTSMCKKNISGGSFYAIALGIGILVATISNLISTGASLASSNSNTTAQRRTSTYVRLSPVPSRSAFSILM